MSVTDLFDHFPACHATEFDSNETNHENPMIVLSTFAAAAIVGGVGTYERMQCAEVAAHFRLLGALAPGAVALASYFTQEIT